ncbi:MAG: bifunctional UDP-sugar hydrolase/5'-nucleotidase [Bacteroidales bacterium]|jgi:5'-nucleotidase/UDP-sugar diphosphatase|nr:bifunctional UDP-sugar hydrolase/5'-nucleotidase [Bacteroidales bacterium]
MNYRYLSLLLFLFIFTACSKNNTDNKIIPDEIITKNLTIFIVNDVHSQLNNFSKVKSIVDKEKSITNVIVASSGDLFSGSPVVDNYPEKGYPMIDVMNKIGFDIAVLGNHEFDYGEAILKDRMDQSNFYWVCANVDMGNTQVPEPWEYKTIRIDNLKVTFLGLVETDGKQDGIIPSTHPWKVQNFTFESPENIVAQYSNIKEQENSDLYIALSHLGFDKSWGFGDVQLAMQFPYFDLIIGGHSHSLINTTVNEIPIFQAGSYLNYLGKIVMTITDKYIESINYELINLNTISEYDSELKADIDEYNNLPYFDEVIGFSQIYHSQSQVGCFMTDALREQMNVDISFQNSGGVRSDLNQGDITKREIFEISPFNNGTIIYSMSVREIKDFLIGSGAGFYYSGVQIKQISNDIQIKDLLGNNLNDDTILSVGIIDYIPAVYDSYFPLTGNVQLLSDAETIISYLENINSQVNYPNCDNYFRYR